MPNALNDKDVVNIIKKLSKGLEEKRYEEISYQIEEYLNIYEKKLYEETQLTKLEKKDNQMQLNLDEEHIISTNTRELFTNVIELIHFNFIEQPKMVNEIETFFKDKIKIAEGNVKLALKEFEPQQDDSLKIIDISVFKDRFTLEEQTHTLFAELFDLGNENGLILKESTLQEKMKNG